MKLLILISTLEFGGAQKQAVNDANMLCDIHDVHLITFKDGNLKKTLSSKVNYSVIEKSGYLSTSKHIANYIKKNNIQLIHASLFASMIIGVMSTIRTHISIFWSFHSHENDIPIKSIFAFNLFSKCRNLKKILFVNRELKEFFANKLNLPINKTEVLYNNTEFKPQISIRNNENIIQIGYVGRIIELKRVHLLLELIEYLNKKGIINFCIQIYGDGDTRKELENYANKNMLNEFVFFHGFKTDLEAVYQSFDIFINPSREECLSIATIDAGIMGKPIIVFDVGGNDEIVIHEKSGFVVHSINELFYYTKYLIENSDKRYQFGKFASKHCEANFKKQIRKEKLINYFTNELYKYSSSQ